MTEETIRALLSPQGTETNGGNSRRSSIANPSSQNNRQNILHRHPTASDAFDSRRNSTGKPNSSKSGEYVIPHHLRASTGSCHDFCKYGRKHAFEEKERQPIPRRTSTTNKNNNIGIAVPAERKKTTVAKLKPSPHSKTHSPDPPEVIKREIMLPSKKVEASSKQRPLNIKKVMENEMKMISSTKRSPAAKTKPAPVSVKPSSSLNVSVGLINRRKSEIKSGKLPGRSIMTVKKIRAPPTASLSPKPSVSRVVSLNPRKTSSLKVVPPLKDQNVIKKAEPRQPNTDKVPEKTLHIVETKIKKEDLPSVQDDGIIQIPSPSPSLSLSLSLSQSLPSPKSLSDPSSSTLSSHGEDIEESEYTTDSEAEEFESENDDVVDIDEGNNNKIQRKGGVVLSEDNECAEGKLKFRRGKIVDLQCENNGPRRLRFRRGRIVGDNEDRKGDARKRRFKKREVDNGANGSSPNSEKVILRHQDAQVKKDSQGLFNNVIEETANKLVESRKSKVKALVGAFETVISLQEIKPSTPTASTQTET
ncbi:hypothetical protein LguiA_006313 [Lonicera macranthoides]